MPDRVTISAVNSLVLRCAGCATAVDPADPTVRSPFRCPNADRAKDIDHVLAWDPISSGVADWPTDPSINPFVRYRTLQHSYWLDRALGATDADHVALVGRLDRAIAAVTGTGFVITPLRPLDAASEALTADIWAKDETGNVAGSHKARHLMGLLLHLDSRRVGTRTPLAIASCGNAALAAATLAKAARRTVQVFVPTTASTIVLEQLKALGATIIECPRLSSDPPGDPCIHRFHEAVAKGALPFCVQGNENGLTIDGGTTLGHELADQLAILGALPDRLLVQVGGGALGSSVFRGLRDALALGVIEDLPKMHFVQTEGAAPLERAWRRVALRALRSLGREGLLATGDDRPAPVDVAMAAVALADVSARAAVEEALLHAATHRSSYMWPWEEEPVSIATGILDDETYDWLALVRAMLTTGGWPLVVSESQIERANALATADGEGAEADETGTAGLAGAVALRADRLLGDGERIVVLITGVRR